MCIRDRVTVDCAGWNYRLDPNEQIHVMHIVREALNNAVKYAGANQISVRLRALDDGPVVIEIDDNGVGLPACVERENHFGLAIMREPVSYTHLDVYKRQVQGSALFMILVLIFIAMYQLNTNVVAPLRDLVAVSYTHLPAIAELPDCAAPSVFLHARLGDTLPEHDLTPDLYETADEAVARRYRPKQPECGGGASGAGRR